MTMTWNTCLVPGQRLILPRFSKLVGQCFLCANRALKILDAVKLLKNELRKLAKGLGLCVH